MNAEQKISQALEQELDAVDKDYIRPFQVVCWLCVCTVTNK